MNQEISVQQLSEGQQQSSTNLRQDKKQIHSQKTKSSLVKGIKHSKEKRLKIQKQLAKQCRICLDGQQEGRMISPCACLGSVAYTHEKCIIQWILHKINTQNKNIQNNAKIICQICQIPFQYNSKRRRYLNMQILHQNYIKYSKSYYIFCIVQIILLLITIAILFIIIKSNQLSEFGLLLRETFIKKQNLKSVYISIVTSILVMALFILILFLIENGMKTDQIISQIYGYSNLQNKQKKSTSKTFLPQQIQTHFEN